MVAVDCLSAGTLPFQCWHCSISVLALFYFSAGTLFLSAGTLAQEGRGTFASECLSAGTLTLECLGVWHSTCLGLGGFVNLR